jgi:hypothetical protein
MIEEDDSQAVTANESGRTIRLSKKMEKKKVLRISLFSSDGCEQCDTHI